MAAVHLDLVGPLSIDQGFPWELLLRIPGDVRQASFRGMIRKSLALEPIAVFRFGTPQFQPEQNLTEIPVLLTSAQTKEIEATVSSYWIYGIRMNPLNGNAQLLATGSAQVNPDPTLIT